MEEFKVEARISTSQLQTKLNQWRHDNVVEVLHFNMMDGGICAAVIKLTKRVKPDIEHLKMLQNKHNEISRVTDEMERGLENDLPPWE